MKGWIVVNSFLKTDKFSELYTFFLNSAKKLNVELELLSGDKLVSVVQDDFLGFTLPDFVIFWDKDVYLAKRLEAKGVKIYNSADSIETCDNKILTTLKLNGKVNMPKTLVVPKTFENVGYNNFDFLTKAETTLGYPFVIKEAFGSFGQQVYLATDRLKAESIFNKISYKDALIQEYISTSYGKDLRVVVVGDKVITCMLRVNENDFRSNVTNGGKAYRYEASDEQKEIAIKACKHIGLTFAGVDLLFGENDTPYVCEVNSNPHFKSTYLTTGVDASMEILKYIVNELNAR